jgi:hypothetical protein
MGQISTLRTPTDSHEWLCDVRAPVSVNTCWVPARRALMGLLPIAAAVVKARPPRWCHLAACTPVRADPLSVQRKLFDEATPPNARVSCLLQYAALCATARLSTLQKCSRLSGRPWPHLPLELRLMRSYCSADCVEYN